MYFIINIIQTFINDTTNKPLIICGPPGSGKSTLAKDRSSKIQSYHILILVILNFIKIFMIMSQISPLKIFH